MRAAATIATGWGAALLARRVLATGLTSGPAFIDCRRERARLVAALPDLLDRLAADLRSGGSLLAALGQATGGRGPLETDLARVVRRVAAGDGLAESIAAWPVERPLPAVRVVTGALEVAVTEGGRVAPALEGLAAGLRDGQDAREEAMALSAQARLSALVVGLAPLGSLAVSALVDGRVLAALLGTAPGRACLAAGLGLEALAGLWMRRILGVVG